MTVRLTNTLTTFVAGATVAGTYAVVELITCDETMEVTICGKQVTVAVKPFDKSGGPGTYTSLSCTPVYTTPLGDGAWLTAALLCNSDICPTTTHYRITEYSGGQTLNGIATGGVPCGSWMLPSLDCVANAYPDPLPLSYFQTNCP